MTSAGVWLRVSSGHQDSDNQVPYLERVAAHDGYEVTEACTVSKSAREAAISTGSARP